MAHRVAVRRSRCSSPSTRRARCTPWRPASPNVCPTWRHHPGCSPSWSGTLPIRRVLDGSRLRRRRRPRRRAGKPRHDRSARLRPPGPKPSWSRLARSTRPTRRSLRASAGALFNVPVVAATLGERRRRRTAADRLVVASGHGAHRGRLEWADRHRRRQRGRGARRGVDRQRVGAASSTAGGRRASTWRWRRRCCASRRCVIVVPAVHRRSSDRAAERPNPSGGAARVVGSGRRAGSVRRRRRPRRRHGLDPGRRRGLLHRSLGRRADGPPSAGRRMVVGLGSRRRVR